ncbi:MAG: hypothetical protein II058_05455, partial [Rhodocyclaceae bacterium]|nr:hypothetical protein [Rhodocyclaceae bacterium]
MLIKLSSKNKRIKLLYLVAWKQPVLYGKRRFFALRRALRGEKRTVVGAAGAVCDAGGGERAQSVIFTGYFDYWHDKESAGMAEQPLFNNVRVHPGLTGFLVALNEALAADAQRGLNATTRQLRKA